jgi:hypothetical protein
MSVYPILYIIILIVIAIYIHRQDIDGPILINKKEIKKYNTKLKKFEAKMSNYYPLNGQEEFKIDHGTIYSKFFDRMGDLCLNICLDKSNNIIATGAGILRNINKQKVWYLCDLKIDKIYRGQWIPFKMLINSLFLVNLSNKAYGISMNDSTKNNKIVRLTDRIKTPVGGFNYAGNLLIYSVDSTVMITAKIIIEANKGKIFYVSLKGTKDLLLKSNNKAMDLYHVNLLKNVNNINYLKHEVSFDHGNKTQKVFMFCFHEKDPIIKILTANNIKTDITASIIHHNMDELTPIDWDFVQTSEI